MSIIYFSGERHWQDIDGNGTIGGERLLHKMTGWTHRCVSFHYLDASAGGRSKQAISVKKYCEKNGVTMMLDSGAHTFLSKTLTLVDKEAMRYCDDYAEYVKREGKHFEWCANFDFQKNCPLIYKVWQRLRKRGVDTVPVYHGDSDLSWVRRYHDEGVRRIGIGKPVAHTRGGKQLRPFYDRVFDLTTKLNMACHGFAVTGQNMRFYPWESVDSTTWLFAARRGMILCWSEQRESISQAHVSLERIAEHAIPADSIYRASKSAQQQFAEMIRQNGFDIKDLQRSGFYRAVWNVKALIKSTERKKHTQWQSIL